MENTKLPWRGSEKPGESFAQKMNLKEGEVALVLLVSENDSDDCCAKNYERTLFRNGKVVSYAKKSLVPFRFSRSFSFGKSLYKKYDLELKKPAVLVLDADGDLLYKRQRCTEPRDCLKGMIGAVVASKKKVAYSNRAKEKIKQAEKLMRQKKFSKALRKLDSIKSQKVVVPLRTKIEKRYSWLERVGKKRLRRARKYEKNGDLERARKTYESVSKSFSRLQKLKKYAQAGLKRIRKLEKETASTGT